MAKKKARARRKSSGKKRTKKTTASKKTAKRKASKGASSARKKATTRKKATRKGKAARAVVVTPRAAKVDTAYRLDDDELEKALLSGQRVDLLEAYFGEEAYAELSQLAARAKRRGRPSGSRVLILPGIMGSKLGKKGKFWDDTIWIDPIDVMRGNLSMLSLGAGGRPWVEPVGVILLAYLRLKLHLKIAGFDASFWDYDWRKSLDELGGQLVKKIESMTTDSAEEGVYLVAHSMGGLVSRAALAKLAGREDLVRRLVMLGTPNYGSFVPVQALRGEHPTVKKVALLDFDNDAADLANKVFKTFPGLTQLLPFKEKYSEVDLYDEAAWPSDAPRPSAALLKQAGEVQRKLAAGSDRCVLIAGVGQETVTGMSVEEVQEKGKKRKAFVFSLSDQGDGTVPLEFARLPGVQTYYVEESHGNLPNNRLVERAVVEILQTRNTELLPTTWSPSRSGATRRVRSSELAGEPFGGRKRGELSARDHRNVLEEFVAPPQLEPQAALQPGAAMRFHGTSAEPIVVGRRRQTRLDIHLAHGSITQVDSRAIVLGMFRDVKPTGAATAVDQALDGAITEFTKRRMFTGKVGEIFVMPAGQQQLRADMVVFVGLGAFDEFDEEVLRLAAENLTRTLIRTKVSDFATVMIGSGSVTNLRDSLSALLEGFFLGILDTQYDSRLRSVTLCEMDRARFRTMRSEILGLATTELFDEIEVTVDELELPPSPPVTAASARLTTKPAQYLVVRQTGSRKDSKRKDTRLTIRSSLLSRQAKGTIVTDEVNVWSKDLDKHLKQIELASFTFDALGSYGQALADLVLPDSVSVALAAGREDPLIVVHDAATSRMPWETLQVGGWHPAAEAGLTRKYAADNLSVAKWMEQRRYETTLDLLLIVNPTMDLDGAEAEGKIVREMFGGNPSVRITEVRHEEATWTTLRALFSSGDFDVVHYAGHAEFNSTHRSESGILCHGEKVLSGADLAGLSSLPALVFFNACESARVRGGRRQSKRTSRGKTLASTSIEERIERSVSLAEAFLRGGIANYVGTYWPVSDSAAKIFAETFYADLLVGKSIGDTLLNARARVRAAKEVDWADYLHYGSPDFVLKAQENGGVQG